AAVATARAARNGTVRGRCQAGGAVGNGIHSTAPRHRLPPCFLAFLWLDARRTRSTQSMSTPAPRSSRPVAYADSGVDIDAGNALVEAIKPLVRATRRPGAGAEIGGFGGLFDPKAAGYRDPL